MAYDAVTDKKVRRIQSSPISLNEDEVLKQRQRRLLKVNIEDQRRNITLVGWMIRTHLAYTVDMSFQAITKDLEFNKELDAFVLEQSHAHNFDIRGIVNARQGFRLLESGALTTGDNFLLKIAQGSGLVQGLESDRICNPTYGGVPERFRAMKMVQGVIRYKSGAPRLYSVCRRERGKLIFDKMAKRGDVIEHSFIERWDQGRGVTPLAAAVNMVQDYHEANVYAALKAKLSHILGFAITRDAGDGENGFLPNRVDSSSSDTTTAQAATTTAEEPSARTAYKLRLGRGGPEMLDFDPGDSIKPIETNHPSFEYQGFTDIEVRAIMLALDFPWTFFDSRKGSYTIQRADKNRYMRSVVPHRERNVQTRNRWLVWKLDRAISETGEFKLPSGWTLDDVKWEWRPGGDTWLDALKEVMASIVAIRMCLTSPQRICLERGLNWYRVREECKEAFEWMRDNGMPVQEWSKEFDEQLAMELVGTTDGESGGVA